MARNIPYAALTALFCALAATTPAHAESLFITGFYPAHNPEASTVNALMVGPISGSDGEALALSIENALAKTRIDGNPWFRLVSARSAGSADAQLSGVANAGLDEQSVRETRNECVEWDEQDKCIRKEDKPIRCTRRIINLTISLKIATQRDGRILYTAQLPKRDEMTWCPDRSATETPEEVISRMIAQVADEVRYDIAPAYRTDKIKVLEARKGMSKPVAQQFKSAVKSTKSNPAAACSTFAAINAQTANLGPVVYNMALCAEKDGKLDDAEKLYAQAGTLMPREDLVYAGQRRLDSRRVAQRVYEERFKR